MNIRQLNMVKSKEALELLPEGKLLIDTINAHSFVTAQKDETFAEALRFFMGSSEGVLRMIRERVAKEYPSIEVGTYSPPYKPVFSEEDNRLILSAINSFDPDLLWIGMTAPKQEKWLHDNWSRLNIHCHAGAIGAVFDFFAGTVQRAPSKWQKAGLEWLYRFIKEPRRMWRRNLISNPLFVWLVFKEKLGLRR